MITKAQIAEACRNNDAEAEERGFEAFTRKYHVDTDGLVYVADQRALRVGMMLIGQSPNVQVATRVPLPLEVRRLMPLFASAFIDGFAAGLRVRDE